MKILTLIAITLPTLFLPSASYGVLGVGDLVSDPPVEIATAQKNIFDQIKYAWEQTQWADKLATLHDTLYTVRANLETLVLVKQALGDPSQIPAILDELALGGALSESGIMDTLSELGGVIREGGMIVGQLEYLARPVDLAGYKNAARMGTLNAFMRQEDPLGRYMAVETAYLRYNGALQVSAGRARSMRLNLNRLGTRIGTASTDAETQKVQSSITVADAALESIHTDLQDYRDQVVLAKTLAENRTEQERAAYHESVAELNREVEANLELPTEAFVTGNDTGTAEPNFAQPVDEVPTNF